jgi:hypothetical protein
MIRLPMVMLRLLFVMSYDVTFPLSLYFVVFFLSLLGFWSFFMDGWMEFISVIHCTIRKLFRGFVLD